ncbi:MAG: phosphoribosylformylglycinamidine cyclo-ligase, partial [Crenarchaeota archaeon]|nr:phosphoribosylformylglycinamidine cyclo-ligase [Thermoproteota archaeon]
KVLLSKYDLQTYINELGKTIGEELSRETYIYSELILELYEKKLIKCAAHVTGGAYTKLKRIITDKLDMILENLPDPPQIFKIIQKEGKVPIEEMYRVFNMGIGMVLVAEPEISGEILRTCQEHGYRAHIIGKIVEGSGKIKVRTYTGEVVEY